MLGDTTDIEYAKRMYYGNGEQAEKKKLYMEFLYQGRTDEGISIWGDVIGHICCDGFAQVLIVIRWAVPVPVLHADSPAASISLHNQRIFESLNGRGIKFVDLSLVHLLKIQRRNFARYSLQFQRRKT